MKKEKLTGRLVVSAVLLLAGGFLLFVESRWPARGPSSAVRYHVNALQSANLSELYDSASVNVLDEYKTQVSRADFKYLSWLYNERIPRIARPIWSEVVRAARAKADEEYLALRGEVASLGRAEYQKLSANDRSEIIRSGTFDRYIMIAGVGALPDSKRQRIPDPEAFYRRRDRSSYSQAEAWRHLSAEEKEALGGPAGLLDKDTPEKLAYFDEVATVHLSAQERGARALVSRDQVASLEVFVHHHGDRLLTEHLTGEPPVVPGLDRLGCESRAAARGALLHGPITRCSNGSGIAFGVTRLRFRWLVTGVEGLVLESES